jgi:flagellar FliL protein
MNRFMPLVILVVLGQTILAYILVDNVVIQRLSGPPPEELKEVQETIAISDEPESIYRDLGEFLINPADSIGDQGFRFVKTEITLGVSPAKVKDILKDQNPKLRDAVIAVLSSKKLEELDSPEDREFIKDELRFALNDFLPSGEILHIYIVSFIVQ